MNDCKTNVSLFSLSFSVFCSAYDLHLYVSAFCETVDVPLLLTAKIKQK